jgi:hypothetical protein
MGVSLSMGLPPNCSAERGTFVIALGSATTAMSLSRLERMLKPGARETADAETVCPPTNIGALTRWPVVMSKKQCAAVNTTFGLINVPVQKTAPVSVELKERTLGN